jgi:hypothetical protein
VRMREKQRAREARVNAKAAQDRAAQERAKQEREAQERAKRDKREEAKQASEQERQKRFQEAFAAEQAKFEQSRAQFEQFAKQPDFDPEEYVLRMVAGSGTAPLTMAEYRALLWVSQPDREATKEEKTKAMQILNDKKFELTGVK